MPALSLDPAIERVLAAYDERARREAEEARSTPPAEILRRRDQWLLAVGPETGLLLNLLVKGAKARTIVEVGASYGYSTVWLAEAARATGGRVISLEVSGSKVEYARGQIEAAGLAGWVDFRVGDALETLERLEERVDLALIDLWKDLYVPSFERLYPRLNPGAIVVADNMLEPPQWREDAERYRAYVRGQPQISSVLLPVGSGVEVSRFRSGCRGGRAGG